jgi:hypothetical protein
MSWIRKSAAVPMSTIMKRISNAGCILLKKGLVMKQDLVMLSGSGVDLFATSLLHTPLTFE